MTWQGPLYLLQMLSEKLDSGILAVAPMSLTWLPTGLQHEVISNDFLLPSIPESDMASVTSAQSDCMLTIYYGARGLHGMFGQEDWKAQSANKAAGTPGDEVSGEALLLELPQVAIHPRRKLHRQQAWRENLVSSNMRLSSALSPLRPSHFDWALSVRFLSKRCKTFANDAAQRESNS